MKNDERIKRAAGRDEAGLARALLFGAGLILLLVAVFFNEFFVGLLDPSPPLRPETVGGIRAAQGLFLLAGLGFIALSVCIGKLSWLKAIARQGPAPKLLLLFLVLFLPVYILELMLRPFAEFNDPKKYTTIYLRDPELGWKLKPNVEDYWGGRLVRINSKGLRGPDLDYPKPPQTVRVLYLGDSVTFGDGLQRYEETFSSLSAAILEKKLATNVQTIDSGVSGYSPWQEQIYLAKEGIKYHPDLVVVGFVLNDVTEKFELVKFGGNGEGWQLSHTYFSYFDQLADHSGIANFARRVGARLKYGRNVQEGAKKKENLDVQSLFTDPERQDVKDAWRGTLADLEQIYGFCRARQIPVILLIFPYYFQFEKSDLPAIPQQIVGGHARQQVVPALDLLPRLAERMKQDGKNAREYFLDSNHFSPLGNQVIAEMIGEFVEKEKIFVHQGQGQ